MGIINGTKVIKGEFPFLVAINKQGSYHCGGALITPKHVLTAAHCVFDYSPHLTVEVGMVKLDSGRSYRVRRAAYFKNFTRSLQPVFAENDIAVVHVRCSS